MKAILLKNNTLLIFLLLFIGSALLSDSFLSGNNLANLLRQTAPIGLISLGMFLVILTGGIDVSVGSIVACIGVTLPYSLTNCITVPVCFYLWPLSRHRCHFGLFNRLPTSSTLYCYFSHDDHCARCGFFIFKRGADYCGRAFSRQF